MATKKTTEVKAEEIQAEIQAEMADADGAEEAKTGSAWDEEVEMYVPRKPKGDDQSYYVCINSRKFAVPANGRMQKLPRPVAEILQGSLEAEARAEEMADQMSQAAIESARKVGL